MPHGARKGAWHFDTMWTLPANMIGSTSFADRCCALDELESAFIRDVVERTKFPMYNKNVEIKYKMADFGSRVEQSPKSASYYGLYSVKATDEHRFQQFAPLVPSDLESN